jgi:hypothetical protein
MHRGFSKLFKDSSGRVVIIQKPNFLIILWFTCWLVSTLASNNRFAEGIAALATAFLFTWAYLEIVDGTNYFRRFLGLTVMFFILKNFF